MAVKIIKAETEDKLVELMNLEEKGYASQTHQKLDGTWVCFLWYEN